MSRDKKSKEVAKTKKQDKFDLEREVFFDTKRIVNESSNPSDLLVQLREQKNKIKNDWYGFAEDLVDAEIEVAQHKIRINI